MVSCKSGWRCWKYPDQAGDIELLDSNEVILPEEEISLLTVMEASQPSPPVVLAYPISEETNPVLTKHDYVDCPHEPCHHSVLPLGL